MAVTKVNKLWVLLFSVIFILFFFKTKAQNAQITTTTDKQRIIIGEPLQYTVQATFPVNSYNITWLNFPDSLAHFEVIERQKTDTIKGNEMLTVQQVIMLTSFDSGSRTIPSFALNFESLTGDTSFNLLTDSIPVNVSFSRMDSTKTFHDIKTIIQVKDELPWWVWIAAGLVAILLIFLIYYLFKRFTKKKLKNLYTSKLSPFEEAVQSLTELQTQQLLVNLQVKQFHSRLGEIFKRYLSRKANFNFLNLTSGEVLLKLNELNVNKENIGLAANNLRMADAVKFAKYTPGNIDSEEAFSGTKKVIEQIDQTILKSKSGI